MKTMRKFMALLIATIMMASNIAPAFATDVGGGLPKPVRDDDKCPIVEGTNIPVKPVTPEGGKSAADLTKNPDQPDIYTLRTDYKVERMDTDGKSSFEINYQPYIASVGESATEEEKTRISKTITLPNFSGYFIPKDDAGSKTENYNINYDTIVEKAKNGEKSGDEEIGLRYEGSQEFLYHGKENEVTVKHVFQDIADLNKYTNLGGDDKEEITTKQKGNTASILEIKPLDEKNRKGFVPEQDFIKIQVPNDTTDFVVEYRYNRAHFNVNFDTDGGTPIHSRTLYYEQEIPKIDANSITKKDGSTFLGWKSSVEIKKEDGGAIRPSDLIKEAELTNGLIMPAEDVTFTAQWKDDTNAGYAIQFWAEKADHADGASLLEKYDYIGTRVYKDVKTGTVPNLDKETVSGIKFPDLDQNRLNKIWKGEKFNYKRDLYLNKFYVYNKDLTDKENSNPQNPNVIKSVSPTGQTVYNIYYDRQIYDLYFTESNYYKKKSPKNTFYPEIWGYDPAKGEAVMLGGPGNPYHYKARFNEMMYKWPNDAKQTKGFTPGYQSFGWGPNYSVPNFPLHLDTPPRILEM